MIRRFEFQSGSSAKFWAIDHQGARVTVTFGKLGTDGQTQTKGFPSATAATKHAEKIIGQKLAKGYREVVQAGG